MLMLCGRSVQSKTILPGPQTAPTIMVFSGVNLAVPEQRHQQRSASNYSCNTLRDVSVKWMKLPILANPLGPYIGC